MFTSTNAGIGASVTTSLAAVVAAGTLAVGLTAGGFAAGSQDVDAGVQTAADLETTLTLEAQAEADLPGPYLWIDGEGAVEIDDGRLASTNRFEGEGTFERSDDAIDEDDASDDGTDEGTDDGAADGTDDTTGTDEPNDDATPQDEETFEVASAGSVTVSLDAEGTISIEEIAENAGYEAYLIGWIGDTLVVEFESDAETVTAIFGELDGELTYELHVEASADYEATASG